METPREQLAELAVGDLQGALADYQFLVKLGVYDVEPVQRGIDRITAALKTQGR